MRKALLLSLFAMIAVLSSCGITSLLAPEPKTSIFHIKCDDCHTSEQASAEDTRGNCYKCHFKYFSNHHPVDFQPTPQDASSAGFNTFPLIDGSLLCQSCHLIHETEHPGDNPNLLRGGPYSDRRDPCFICHYKEQYADIYVHRMLDSGQNVVEVNGKPICLFCHREKPNPLVDRTKDVTFKADVGFLCWRCHPPMPQAQFFGAHFLVEPTLQTLKYMKSYEKKNNVIFPIVPHNRITCSTCHNPHQKGVIKHEPATKGADEKSRLRLRRPEICLGCHGY